MDCDRYTIPVSASAAGRKWMIAMWIGVYIFDAVLILGLWFGRKWILNIEAAPGDEWDIQFSANAFLVLLWIVVAAAIVKLPFMLRMLRKPKSGVSL